MQLWRGPAVPKNGKGQHISTKTLKFQGLLSKLQQKKLMPVVRPAGIEREQIGKGVFVRLLSIG